MFLFERLPLEVELIKVNRGTEKGESVEPCFQNKRRRKLNQLAVLPLEAILVLML